MGEKIIIVGNGITGITAIKSIREIDQESEIHLFGEEKFYPYNRIRLSKGLLSTLEEENILLQKKNWYKENNVQLYLDSKIISIDTDQRSVRLSNGNKVNYTKLLLVNGARNFIPPIPGMNKEGVVTLRTLQNAWDIMDKIKNSNTILNIGGGIQGLEIAWILSQMGKKVMIAELFPRLMPKQLDETASKILQRALYSHGIEIMLNTQISEINGTNRVQGFKTKEGNCIPCNMVIYSTGIQPNIEILEGTSIKVNKGIMVDHQMKTNVDDVYAAGDIAEFENEIYGLWNISIGHGKVAGYNIAGKDYIYEHIVPVTTLNAFGLSLFSMGMIEEEKATDIIIEYKEEKNIYHKVLMNHNKIVGAIVIGDIKYSPLLKTAIEKEINLRGVDDRKVSFNKLIEIIKKNK